MFISPVLQLRPIVLLRLDLFDGSANTLLPESSFPRKTAYWRLSSSLFLNCDMNPHCVAVWRWSSPVLLSNRRMKDLHVRRRIITAVALSMTQAVESDTKCDDHKEEDYCDEGRNVDGNSGGWIGAGMPSSIPGNEKFRMALTVLPAQERSHSCSPTNRVPAFDCQGACLDFAQNDGSRILTKEETLLSSLQENPILRSCPEEDTPIIEAEKSRRKKISQANKGKIPWNKGKRISKGALQSLDIRTAVAVENLRDVDDDTNLLVREKWRRQRISRANKGKAPWNKGRQHSEETKQLIRARTMEAMKDPKIREKLRVFGVKQSSETRLKISTAIINRWNEKRKIKQTQESCVEEWEEMIAQAARIGDDGDEVYQWNSYATIMKELQDAFKLSSKERKRSPLRVAFSSDHKTKISEAIKAKWADPVRAYKIPREISAYCERGCAYFPSESWCKSLQEGETKLQQDQKHQLSEKEFLH